MTKKAGPFSQIWCRTPFTHWMCSGYRFDLLDGVKVEGLCTCTCHMSGERGVRGVSHAQNMVDDPNRFEQARLATKELYKRAGFTEDDYPN